MFDIKKVLNIVWEAGSIVNKMYIAGQVNAKTKSDLSPLTDADMASHRYICDALASQFSLPVVSEEGEVPYDVRREWKNYWLIDPLDGTQEFISRTGEFTVNVALIQEDISVMGVVYAPVLGETYYAMSGMGAFEIRGGKHHRLPYEGCRPNVALTSRFGHTPMVAEFAKINNITEIQTVGAALKFGRLARGDAVLYPRYGGSKEWDVAAGHVLVKESGGAMIDLTSMEDVLYNKPSTQNGPFVAVGDSTTMSRIKFLDETHL